jgi:hypothetical protein
MNWGCWKSVCLQGGSVIMGVMSLDDGTKFMQTITDVSKVHYFHLQCGKLKELPFLLFFMLLWRKLEDTVWSILGVYGVYNLRCLGNTKPNYLFIYSFKSVYVYLWKHSDHYRISFQHVINFQRTWFTQSIPWQWHACRSMAELIFMEKFCVF